MTTTFTAADHRYMAEALALAERGRYTTLPNPRVGCVLVRDDEIVGRGWTQPAGGPHAEIEALSAAGPRARGATAYVTLEPCGHHGRTPPCADALRDAGVSRVVVAVEDPNPQVAGSGLARLAAAGVETAVGLEAERAEELNAGFFKRMRTGRPRIIVKLAASLDGRTAMASGESKWITGAAARADVHRLRAEAGAILTGAGTVLADDPALTVRDFPLPEGRRQPLRVVVDSDCRTPPTAKLLAAPQSALIVCGGATPVACERLAAAGAEVVAQPTTEGGGVDLAGVLAMLGEREINDVLVEAGATLSGALLRAGLVDELVVYMAPHLMGDAARPLLVLPGLEAMADRRALEWVDVRRVGADLRLRLRPVLS